MPINNYTYPRVTTNVNAAVHSSVAPAAEDTTNLFMPLITKMGPIKTVTRVHSLAEFISIFGDLDYEVNGISALQTYNWLTNGGTVYAYRLQNSDQYASSVREKQDVNNPGGNEEPIVERVTIFTAKYPGSTYNTLAVNITFLTERLFNLSITLNASGTKAKTVESFPMLNIDNYQKVLLASSYIKDFIIPDEDLYVITDGVARLRNSKNSKYSYTITDLATDTITENGTSKTYSQVQLLEKFWGYQGKSETQVNVYNQDEESECYQAIANKLETPIDLVLDAAYPLTVKQGMAEFIKANETDPGVRDDIYGYFDDICLWEEKHENQENLNEVTSIVPSKLFIVKNYTTNDFENDIHNFVFNGHYVITDNIFTDQDIYVGLTYFFSSMIPYSDALYGIQYPLAGHRRGVLSGCKNAGKSLTPAEKEKYFTDRINYVEKTPNEVVIMTQRTHDGSTIEAYTALSFINNVRVIEKIKKDIEFKGRNYLYEFNDSVSLTQMSNLLNKYIAEWISNRTLEYGQVVVNKSAYSDEAVDVDIYVKFRGTIEVIHNTISIA